MKIISALRLIETLEEQMFLAYDKLGKTFSSDTDAAAFFNMLKKEELSHSALAKKQIFIAENSPALAEHEVRVNIAAMDEAIEMLKEAQDNPPATINEALALTYVLESNSVEHYVASLLKGASPEIDQMLSGYAEAFCEHTDKVMGFIRQRRLAPISPSHRTLIQLRVPYKTTIEIEGKGRAEASDISEGGMYISQLEGAKKGDTLKLRLPMPEGIITIQGAVQGINNGSGAGVMFTSVGDKEAASLRVYIDSIVAGNSPELKALPAPPPPKQLADEPVKKSATTPAKKERVLFINNSVFAVNDIRNLVNAVEEGGYEAVLSNSLTDSKEKLAENIRHRLLIVSAETENDESFGLLEVIRRDSSYSNVPIIVLSTSYDRVFRNRVDAYGAHFIMKPSLTPDKLLAMLG